VQLTIKEKVGERFRSDQSESRDMKKLFIMVLMVFVLSTMAACGQKEATLPEYPELKVEEAKKTLDTFMELKGYQGELPVVKEIKKDKETKDGRPAMHFVMTSEDGSQEGVFVVSINKKNFEDYTADLIDKNY